MRPAVGADSAPGRRAGAAGAARQVPGRSAGARSSAGRNSGGRDTGGRDTGGRDAGGRDAGAAGAPLRPFGIRVGHALGVTSPRRVAMLAAVLCAMVLSVAVPLRNYVAQRSELAQAHEQQAILRDKVGELERRRALLSDPSHIEAQAKQRLGYVRAGETPYVVQLPARPAPGAPAPGAPAAETPDVGADQPGKPWFTRLWESIVGG